MKKGGLFTVSICGLLFVALLATLAACSTPKPAPEPITEIRYSGIGIPAFEKFSVKAGDDRDEIIFGGKFNVDIGGKAEPCTAFSGGGVTFEKKEATGGTRPDGWPPNLKYYVIDGAEWENFTIERNYHKDNKDWIEWWEETKEGEIEYQDFTLTYLDRKGNPTGRRIKGFNAFPIRYDVINLDSRSGSAAVRETLELVVERVEYEGSNGDDGTSEKALRQELLSKGFFQAIKGAEKSVDVTQVSKFKLDIISAGEKTPTGGWWSITGGEHNIALAEPTEGPDADVLPKPGQAYYGDITVRGPFLKDRKAIMQWIDDTAKGKGDRKDLTLEFLNKKEEVLMSFTLKECLPVSYSPPSVSTDNYSLLEETFSFLVNKIEQP